MATKKTRTPAIEGRAPLRTHHDVVGEKAIRMPRGTDAPTPRAALRRGRLEDYAHAEHELELPVKVATDKPIAPTRIRTKRPKI